MKHAFSIDYEDWYQGMAFDPASWGKYEQRIRIGHDRLLNLLDRHQVKATYFLLGKTIEEHPQLIREIMQAGHEIGCHTFAHRPLYQLTPEAFRDDLQQCKAAIAAIGGSYTGFRAPYFSIDQRSWWAIDVLREEGFLYDSSVFPGNTFRTGIPGFRHTPHLLEEGLPEYPMTTYKMMQFTPGTGGAYFRILPYTVFRNKLRQIEQAGEAINFYIHPWELDEHHPYLKQLSARVRLPHYYNLKNTAKRIDQLLGDFEFGTVQDVLKTQKLLS